VIESRVLLWLAALDRRVEEANTILRMHLDRMPVNHMRDEGTGDKGG